MRANKRNLQFKAEWGVVARGWGGVREWGAIIKWVQNFTLRQCKVLEVDGGEGCGAMECKDLMPLRYTQYTEKLLQDSWGPFSCLFLDGGQMYLIRNITKN